MPRIWNLFFYFKHNNLDSGPWGIPILGYLPFILLRNPLKVFPEFKTKYGKVFSLTLGDFGYEVQFKI